MEWSAIEEEPEWPINDDFPVEYPQYVRLLLLTGLRLGIPCEKMHQLFQICGDWKLQKDTSGCVGGDLAPSEDTEKCVEAGRRSSVSDKLEKMYSALFPICESFEDPSKTPRYCAHLQRESAATWVECPDVLPPFRYCKKEGKKKKEEDVCDESNHCAIDGAEELGKKTNAMLKKTFPSSTMPPLDCLYCFHEQLWKEEHQAGPSTETRDPVLIVETLAGEEVENTSFLPIALSISSSSSLLLRHYHTHQMRMKHLLAMLEQEVEIGEPAFHPPHPESKEATEENSFPTEAAGGKEEIEAKAERESRHGVFVCAGGTSMTPVVVTYCATCEMFSPLTSFQCVVPVEAQQPLPKQDNHQETTSGCVGSNGREDTASSSTSLDPCRWISTDPSSIIAGRFMMALYVLQQALPDLLYSQPPMDAGPSYPSTIVSSSVPRPSFVESAPPQGWKGRTPSCGTMSTEENAATAENGRSAEKRDAGKTSLPVGTCDHTTPSHMWMEGEDSIDLRTFGTAYECHPSHDIKKLLSRSSYLFSPTPLPFQDPPPLTPSLSSSEEVEGEGEGSPSLPEKPRDGHGRVHQDPRQFLTDTFEENIMELSTVEAILPGACWVVAQHDGTSTDGIPAKTMRSGGGKDFQVSKKEEIPACGVTTLSVCGAEVPAPPPPMNLTTTAETTEKEEEEGTFLLYLCPRSDWAGKAKKGVVEPIPWNEDHTSWNENSRTKTATLNQTTTPFSDGEANESMDPMVPSIHKMLCPSSSFSPSSTTEVAALRVHDVVVGLLIRFSTPDVLAQCIHEALVPQLLQVQREPAAHPLSPSAPAAALDSSAHPTTLVSSSLPSSHYHPLPYRFTYREVYHPDEERWIEAGVLYHEPYSFPLALPQDVEVPRVTMKTGCRYIPRKRWLGEDTNGFRRACASHLIGLPCDLYGMEDLVGNASFPTAFLSVSPFSHAVPSSNSAAARLFGSPVTMCVSNDPPTGGTSTDARKLAMILEEKHENIAEEVEDHSLCTSSSSSDSFVGLPLRENPTLLLTAHHPLSVEACQIKVLIRAGATAQAIRDVLLLVGRKDRG